MPDEYDSLMTPTRLAYRSLNSAGNPGIASVKFQRVELEIVRGKARCRRRSVKPPAFLIGSADDNDLILADAQFPPLHSYVFCGSRTASIRCVGFSPELSVNGIVTDSSPLEDGDIIRTGPYEFRIRIQRPDSRHTGPNSDIAPDTLLLELERGRREVMSLLYEVRCQVIRRPNLPSGENSRVG